MANPPGEPDAGVLKLYFDRRLMLQFPRVRGHARCGIVGIPRTRRRARLDRDGDRSTRRCAHRKERLPCAGAWNAGTAAEPAQ